ncbi:ead/Ea22-like family protein [Budvicia aquatica]|uniref:ead/Ea22-like family protein n=1 Tax=Budvicia aquatica TaxID=82979 RepID=UPI00208D88A3|nr:ead/Ea22-like family protein [Budvicia aquatica]GKX50569.1 hypothetical protein SOASR029_08780 [Budvicia aquatica]
MTTNTDINTLSQQLRVSALKASRGVWRGAMTRFNGITNNEVTAVLFNREPEAIIASAVEKRDAEFIALANPINTLIILDALEAAQKRIAELEASQPVVPNELLKIGELIRTQDNRATEQPLFAVMQKREYVGHQDYSAGGHDRIAWVDEYGDEADEQTSRRLELLNKACRDTRGWERLKVFEVDEFVTACFTEQGCNDHIVINGHNLNKPFVYAFGSFRNAEYRAIRDWLIAAPALQEG